MDYTFRISDDIEENWGFGTAELQLHLNQADGADLFIDINSLGGSVDIGLAIFAELKRYAKENQAKITTRTDGFVCSIATIIFLAGSKRIVNEYMQPFVHEPWADTWAETADDYEQSADMLKKTRDILAGFYENHTTLSKQDALDMMADNTWLTADECLAIGFATEIEKLSDVNFKLVAKFKNKVNKKKNVMSKPTWRERIASIVGTPDKKNALEIADVSGNPIVFPDLDPDSTPLVGQAITVDGDANYTGSVETNDWIITVEAGKVTEVSDALEEAVDLLLDAVDAKDVEIAASKKENDRLNKIISSLKKGSAATPDTDKGTKEEKEKSSGVSALQKAIDKRKKNK